MTPGGDAGRLVVVRNAVFDGAAILDGDPGLGKSALTLDIAARITTGSPMPDGSPGVDGGVVVLNAEDDEADTIVPRLMAMNADLTRVRLLKTFPGSWI